MLRLLSVIAAACLVACAARAETVSVAVAANFTNAATEIAAAFAQATGHEAVLSFGATSHFYTQIKQGAPFEVFLAADNIRPAQAIAEGLGVEGTVFTYAIGQLVLYSRDMNLVLGPETLQANQFQKIAIANPETAPYGVAAMETMRSLGVFEALQPKIVRGQNIGQAYQFVESGNAELGFLALGQVAQSEAGSRWLVPPELYTPIRQDAVLLKNGEANPVAAAFLDFLQGEPASAIMVRYGYATDH